MTKKKCQPNNNNNNGAKNFNLSRISPKTVNQTMAFSHFENGHDMLLHGYPGTGKSFISLYLALRELRIGTDLLTVDNEYDKITIIRSAVPSRDLGFLPGNEEEKSRAYEEPYENIVCQLYNRGDAYKILRRHGRIEFMTTSFLRGLTLDNTILILDEGQNCTIAELHTVLTRVGENTRVIICGDMGQNDLVYKRTEVSGLLETMRVLKKMDRVRFVEFDSDDIVRSGFVRDYIMAKEGVG